MIIILDLDNCIANDEWRIPKIQWQFPDAMRRYHSYHSLSCLDEVGNQDLIEESKKHEIFIFTARPNLYRPQTEEWLKRKGIEYKDLFMRENYDPRNSVILKRDMLHQLVAYHNKEYEDILCAYDDRIDIVDMYKKEGIKAQIRSIHNVCAITQQMSMLDDRDAYFNIQELK